MLDPDNQGQMADFNAAIEGVKQNGYLNGRMSRIPLVVALRAIRDMPNPEKDTLRAADMRKIAEDALAAEVADG